MNELILKLQICYNVYLYLPKFKTEFKEKLKRILKEMNMNRAFSNGQFNKMTLDQIFINEIIHKTFIQVDEEGTEAAAFNRAITVYGLDQKPDKEYYMYVNHSFIYMIVSDEIKDSEGNYLIPFLGVVNKLDGEIIQQQSDITKKNDTDLIKETNVPTTNPKGINNKNDNNNFSAIEETNITITNENNIINNISSNKASNIKLNKTTRFLFVVAAIFLI